MIPILYSENEKDFKNNGLGGLSDAIDCVVTEERNGSYELKMTYPIGGIHFSDIKCQEYICAVPADNTDPQPFEIYSITRPINGKVTIKARHISYQLSYIVTLPGEECKSAASALQSLKSNAATDCPFSFSTDVIANATFQNTKPQSIRALLGGQSGSIIDQFGGEYLFDKFNVKLLQNRGSTIPVSLEYGKNITDLQQEESIGSTYTAVIAFWKNQIPNGTVKTVYGDLVKSGNADNFPYVRTLALDVSTEYQSEPSKDTLTKRAKKYIKSNDIGVPKVSIKLSFVALWQTEEYKDVAPLQHIHLCDTIKVKFPKLGVNANAKISKTVYNVLKDRYDSLEIGDIRSSLSNTISKQTSDLSLQKTKQSEWLWDATKRATEIIRGGMGGYVVIRPDEQTGYPEEILIMDQPDKDTAKNVVRMNKNGIGFSLGNGYDGPFESAWTIDGTFNANFINAGTVRADLIKTKRLEDSAGSGNFWDMDTGEFQLSSSAKVGDSTVASQKDVDNAQKEAEEKAKEISNSAADLARAAQNTANSKITTYYQSEAPSEDISVGDLWMDIDNDNNLSRWDGSEWINVTDKGIASAMEAANTAQATADGKVVTYAQTNAPTSSTDSPLTVGDLWLDTDDNNHPYRWSGTEWAEVRDGFIQEAANAAQKNAEEYAGQKAEEAIQTSNKYTDEQRELLNKSLNQEEVFNRLTENGTVKGIYMKDGQLYINADYIASGTLDAELVEIKSKNSTSGDVMQLLDGTIVGTDGTTGKQVKLTIGDGLFDIDGELALNGNVGVTGTGTYVKSITWETVNINTWTVQTTYASTDDFVKSVSLSGGGVSLSGGGVSLTGGSVGYGVTPSINGTTATITYKNAYNTNSYVTVVTSVTFNPGTISHIWPTASLTLPNASLSLPTVSTSTGRAYVSLPTFASGTTSFDIPVRNGITTGAVTSKYGIITGIT